MTTNNKHDPSVPLNCPKCGKALEYRGTVREIHVYDCATDGRICLRPVGRDRTGGGVERWFQVYRM